VAYVRDGFPPQTIMVRVDGKRSSLLVVQKVGIASTLSVVAGISGLVPRIAAGLPPELVMTPWQTNRFSCALPLKGVIREGTIAACLTAIMILTFLGSWRSTLIIAVSIAMAILASIIVLSALGETINIMTLGGLALAVGILVDDATVESKTSTGM
jgi:multidrug efflux pump subunit AcrB